MKKLTKINLHGAQIMNDAQLKHILGGGDDSTVVDKLLGYGCSPNSVGLTCMVGLKKGVCVNAGAGVVYCETMPEMQ